MPPAPGRLVSMARKGRQAVLEGDCYFNQLAEPKGTATSNPIYMDQAAHFQKMNRMKENWTVSLNTFGLLLCKKKKKHFYP